MIIFSFGCNILLEPSRRSFLWRCDRPKKAKHFSRRAASVGVYLDSFSELRPASPEWPPVDGDLLKDTGAAQEGSADTRRSNQRTYTAAVFPLFSM